MNAATGGIPRYRPSTGPAFLQEGFRPFFLGAALWSALALCLWLGNLAGHVALPTAFDALTWHGHEMIFGFAVAAVSGFLLTAIPNWTGRLPLQGGPLAVLARFMAHENKQSRTAWPERRVRDLLRSARMGLEDGLKTAGMLA